MMPKSTTSYLGEMILLLMVKDTSGIYLFANNNGDELPGIFLKKKPLTQTIDRIRLEIARLTGNDEQKLPITLRTDFYKNIKTNAGQCVDFVLAEWNEHLANKPDLIWYSLPSMLSKMPHKRDRLPYINIMQILLEEQDAKYQ